jgi:N-acetylglucosamine kinase-like BadF-type ATPase
VTAGPVLAIDAGKSTCRAARFDQGGRGPTVTGPGFANVASPGGVEQIRSALEVTLASLGRDHRYEAVCLGSTGVLRPDDQAGTIAAILTDLALAPRVAVTSDVVTTFCGALGLQPGVVVAAGTGAITLAAGPDGRLVRVDGWGYLLDDAGSAFEIGRAGLREALRANDGRGGSPSLLEAAVAAFGGSDGMLATVYGALNPARLVASFAPEVTAVARAGDPIAVGILQEAGRSLAHSVASAAAQVLDPGTVIAVSWQGGVFRAGDLVLAPFRETLATRLPAARIVPPRGDALDGAAAIARAAESTFLDPLIERVERVAS